LKPWSLSGRCRPLNRLRLGDAMSRFASELWSPTELDDARISSGLGRSHFLSSPSSVSRRHATSVRGSRDDRLCPRRSRPRLGLAVRCRGQAWAVSCRLSIITVEDALGLSGGHPRGLLGHSQMGEAVITRPCTGSRFPAWSTKPHCQSSSRRCFRSSPRRQER